MGWGLWYIQPSMFNSMSKNIIIFKTIKTHKPHLSVSQFFTICTNLKRDNFVIKTEILANAISISPVKGC